jgi:hypothetical protein
MAMLLGELATLAVGAGGSLDGGIRRARRVTSDFVGRLIEGARARGLAVRGAWGVERRAAFVVLRVPNGVAIAESMARAGLRVDVRPVPGSTDGYVRVSGNAAAMAYEADALLDAVTEHRDLLAGR